MKAHAPQPPYIFCDPFAGMAAMTYWLMGCKPPISYMGSKAGYAHIIAAILGLSRHHRPAAVVLGDVGPTVAVHAGLFGATGVTARDVAGMVWVSMNSYRRGDPDSGIDLGDGRQNPAHNRQSGSLSAVSDSVVSPPLPQAPAIAAIIRSWKDEEPRALWTRLKAEGWPSLMPVEGGRWLGPQPVEEVARWLWSMKRTHHDERSFMHQMRVKPTLDPAKAGRRWMPEDPAPALDALPAAPFPLACWQGTATRLVEQLPERLDSWITYLDPPYSGTTGYKFGDCSRSEVLRLALDLHRRGATVAISEAVRLDRELGDGWHAVDIGTERRGQKRTFGATHEWLTLNRAPKVRPGVQVGLWGAR